MHPTKAYLDSFSLPMPTKCWKYSETKPRSVQQIFHAKLSPFRRIWYQLHANPQVWPFGSNRRPKQQGPAVTSGCYKSLRLPMHLGSSWSSSSRTCRIPMRKLKEVSMTSLGRFHCDWHVPSPTSTNGIAPVRYDSWIGSGMIYYVYISVASDALRWIDVDKQKQDTCWYTTRWRNLVEAFSGGFQTNFVRMINRCKHPWVCLLKFTMTFPNDLEPNFYSEELDCETRNM